MSRPELVLPPIGFGGHLVDLLFDVGPSSAGEVITFQEIVAWQRVTGVRLDAWEAETLRRLSHAYLAEIVEAKDPDRPAPYRDTPPPPPAEVASKLEAMFDRLAAQDAKKGLGPKPAPEVSPQARRRRSPEGDAPASRVRG